MRPYLDAARVAKVHLRSAGGSAYRPAFTRCPAAGPEGCRTGRPWLDFRVVQAVQLYGVVHGDGHETGVVGLGEDLDPKDVGSVGRRDADRGPTAVRDAPHHQLGCRCMEKATWGLKCTLLLLPQHAPSCLKPTMHAKDLPSYHLTPMLNGTRPHSMQDGWHSQYAPPVHAPREGDGQNK